MYSFVSEEIGALIVNSVLLFLAFVVFLLVTLAILTALRLSIGADQARFKPWRQAQALLLAVTQAGEVEEVLGLHEG